MPATKIADTVVVTKNTASGNFQFLVQDPFGGIKYALVLSSADMATAAALGSGASSTFTYAQDVNRGDLPLSYTYETF
jgi:hypothetical protein